MAWRRVKKKRKERDEVVIESRRRKDRSIIEDNTDSDSEGLLRGKEKRDEENN